MNNNTLALFKKYFAALEAQNDFTLDDIYSNDVHFKDPIHEIHGIAKLKAYFEKLNGNLIEGTFTFIEESIVQDKVFLTWEMNIQLKRPKKKIKASGISVLTINNKIVAQRDYFDAGELFYENIPILGSLLGFIKKQLTK